jgi:hypothetical protein
MSPAARRAMDVAVFLACMVILLVTLIESAQ